MTKEVKAALIGALVSGGFTFICTFVPMNITIENNNANWIKAIAEISDEVEETMSKEKTLENLSLDIESKKEEIKKKDDTIASKEKELEDSRKIIEEYSSKENINNIITQASDYWNNNDYSQALLVLRESERLSEDISLLYKQYSSEYCTMIISQANEFISGRKLDEAKNLINSNIDLVKDKTQLKDKLEEIENNKPVKLSSLKLTDSRYYENISSAGISDTVGNIYMDNSFILTAEGTDNCGYSTYYLGGKYNAMSLCIAVADESEIRDDSDLSGWLGIYRKDGEEYALLKRIDNITRVMSPIEIDDLNLSGSEWLEIRYYNNGEYWNLAGGYHSLEVIVGKGMLYR